MPDEADAFSLNYAQARATFLEAAKAAGCTTLAQISDHLNALGWRTREGSEWCPATTRRVLVRLAEMPKTFSLDVCPNFS